MAALEDGVIDTGDIVDTGNGTVKFYNKVIKDTREEGYGKLCKQQLPQRKQVQDYQQDVAALLSWETRY